MSRTLWQVIAILALLHLAGVAGAVGWLAATDRLSRERILAVRDLFSPTVAEEEQQKKKADTVAREAQQQVGRVELARVGPAANLALSVDQQLSTQQDQDELRLRQLERTRKDLESLRQTLDLEQANIEKQHAELLAEKQQLEQKIRNLRSQLADAGFKRAVALYEALPPKQVKQMFVDLLSQQRIDDVAAYLEAMQARKAAAVLKEFKTPQETQLAVQLTQKLRARGKDVALPSAAGTTTTTPTGVPSGATGKPESVG